MEDDVTEPESLDKEEEQKSDDAEARGSTGFGSPTGRGRTHKAGQDTRSGNFLEGETARA